MLQAQSNKIVCIHSSLCVYVCVCVSKHRVISVLFDKIETQEVCREHPPTHQHTHTSVWRWKQYTVKMLWFLFIFLCFWWVTSAPKSFVLFCHVILSLSLSPSIYASKLNTSKQIINNQLFHVYTLSRSSDQKYWSWGRSCCRPSAHRQGSLEESSTWGGEFHLRSSNFD